MVVALLAVSTLPASYHFVLLLLPCAVWTRFLMKSDRGRAAVFCLVSYFLIGWPIWPKASDAGWYALLGVPRLWLLFGLTVLLYRESWRKGMARLSQQRIWVGSFAVVCVVQIISLGRHEMNLHQSQQWRLSTSSALFSIASPSAAEDGTIAFSAMTLDGWRLGQVSANRQLQIVPAEADQLSVVSDRGSLLGRGKRPGASTATGAGSRPTSAPISIHPAPATLRRACLASALGSPSGRA